MKLTRRNLIGTQRSSKLIKITKDKEQSLKYEE